MLVLAPMRVGQSAAALQAANVMVPLGSSGGPFSVSGEPLVAAERYHRARGRHGRLVSSDVAIRIMGAHASSDARVTERADRNGRERDGIARQSARALHGVQ